MILLCFFPFFTLQILIDNHRQSLYSAKSSDEIHNTNFFPKKRHRELLSKNSKIPQSSYTCSTSNPSPVITGDFSTFLTLDIQNGCQNINCKGCNFNDIHIETSSTQSSIIYVKNAQFSIQGNSNFNNCFSEKQIQSTSLSETICHTIFIDNQPQKATISQSHFTNCGNSASPTGFLIISLSQQLDLLNTNFEFEQISKACPCLSVFSKSQFTANSCSFKNSNNLDSDAGGGCISYSPLINLNAKESISIQNSQFLNGAGRACAFSLSMQSTRPTLYNLNIETSNAIKHSIVITVATSTNEKLETILNDITFTNLQSNDCGVYYQTQSSNDKLIFHSCTFEHCAYGGTSENDNEIDGGGAISITDLNCRNFDVVIEESTFNDCTTTRNDGGAICIHTNKAVKITSTVITNCRTTSTSNTGSCICVQSDDPTDSFCLDGVTIQNSISSSKYPGLYYLSSKKGLIVQNCKFINIQVESTVNTASGFDSSLIYAPHGIERFECINTVFKYDEQQSTNCRAIFTRCVNNYIDGCTFEKTGIGETSFGGSIYYVCTDFEDDDITIINCIFDSCSAADSGAFKLELFSCVPVLSNNTIRNINSCYTISFLYNFIVQLNIITIENHTFIKNTNSAIDGGGSGIYIRNFLRREVGHRTIINLFKCNFFDNLAQNSGGAYGVGGSNHVKQTELSIQNCNFTGNSCNDINSNGGGALWIRTSCSAEINHCTFLNNKAINAMMSTGGAIYLSFASELMVLQILNSVLIGNKCDAFPPRGHAIYTTILYGVLDIDNCSFIDNGISAHEIGTVIFSQSEISVTNSLIAFSDKDSDICSQGFYVSTSSPFRLHNSSIINCTNGFVERGGAITYIITHNRDPGLFHLHNDTFESNTNFNGYELELVLDFIPEITNCTFISDCPLDSLFCLQFSDPTLASSIKFENLTFYQWTDQFSHVLLSMKAEEQYSYIKEVTIDSCVFNYVKEFELLPKHNINFNLINTVFTNNFNRQSLLHFQTNFDILIDNCLFTNNMAFSYDSSDSSILYILSANSCTITNTNFIHEVSQESDDLLVPYIIKACCNIICDNVTIQDCAKSEYALLFDPSAGIRPLGDGDGGYFNDKTIFCITNCNFLDSGDVCIFHKAVEFTFINSTVRNTKNGLIYDIETHLFPPENDCIDVRGSVFDNLSICACSLYVWCSVTFENNTIKNCYHDDLNTPLCSIQFFNDTFTSFTFKDFVFENNQVKNGNANGEFLSSRFVNGGGSGLCIEFDNHDVDLAITFENCHFYRNHASSYGGAFAFSEENPSTIFTFRSCSFNDNECDRLRGSVLYLLCEKVTINNCLFRNNSKADPRSSMVFQQSEITDDEIDQNSVIFMPNLCSETTFSMTFCAFENNNPGYCLFERNCNDLFLSDCKFFNNSQRHLNLVVFNNIQFDKCEFLTGPQRESGIKEVSSIRISDCVNECSFIDCQFNEFSTPMLFSIHAPKLLHFIGCEIITALDGDTIMDRITGYAISCSCTQSFVLANTKVVNTGGVLLTSNSTTSEIVRIACSEISGTKNGFLFDENNKIRAELEIDSSNFSDAKYALSIQSNNFSINAVVIKNCICHQQTNENAIFQLKIPSTVAQFVLNDFKFINNEFSHQSRYKMGGGIGFVIIPPVHQLSLVFERCLFESNKAVSGSIEHGGAFYYEDSFLSSLAFRNCHFSLNTASGDGGALFIRQTFPISILNCHFINNTAQRVTGRDLSVPSDAILINGSHSLNFENCSFSKISRYKEVANVQLTLALNHSTGVTFKNCSFSIANPNNPQIYVKGSGNEQLLFSRCSFTYFLLVNPIEIDKAKILSAVNTDQASLLSYSGYEQGISIDYTHVRIDFSGSSTFENSCFDTSESDVKSYSHISNVVFNSNQCFYPPIMDEMMDALVNEFTEIDVNTTSTSKNINTRRLVIGLALGLAFLLVIAALIAAIVLFIRSKKRKFEAAKRQKRIQEEFETIRDAQPDDTWPTFHTQENILYTMETQTIEGIFDE